jgi:hypothetical protein
MNRDKLKVVLLLSLLIVGFILNNIIVFLFLNLLLLVVFPANERSNLSYLRKPKFLLSITLISVLPLLLSYWNENNFIETLVLVSKVLLRALFVLQIMSILYNRINKDRIVGYFDKIFPHFQENLELTIETMTKLKQNLIENKSLIFTNAFWKKLVFHPKATLKNLITRAWTVYSTNRND